MTDPTPFVLEQGLLPDPARCFLCGDEVDGSNTTREHVFPQWLLNKFDLWNEPLTLLNGTAIQYRQLTIPCCAPCNNEHLSALENRVKAALSDGIDGIARLEQPDLYLWMVKIYYGLLFRNLTLPADRRSPASGNIVHREDLGRFRFLHLMLQGVRGVEVRMQNAGTPGSCLIVPAQTSTLGHASLNWDYFDVPHVPFLAVRIGPLAIFAGMEDFGAMAHFAAQTKHFDAARRIELHPGQFQELSSLCAAIAMWVSDRRDYAVDTTSSLNLIFDEATAALSIPPFMHKDEFLQLWAQAARLRGQTEATVGRMPTLLFNEDMTPRHLDMNTDIAAGRFTSASQARKMRSTK